ncbi:choice-of-anchor P family protein [Actinomadura sp. SCN-SB]|uniref:choice-of-anchor P family protein n=1 Tax=Actinomadura sp. SCN-SB TaxID=3373092 RepID=UPI00375105C7
MRSQVLSRAAVLAGAVALPLAAVLPAHAQPAHALPEHGVRGASGSAYGIAATGPVAVPATPSVSSSGPNTVSRSVAELPPNPILKARALNASAGKARARASVVDLRIPKAHLTADLVAAKCVQGKGGSHLVKVALNGKVIKAAATPNSAVGVHLDGLGTVSLVLNKQVRDRHGRLTVTAIELTLPLGPGTTETISIASATCGAGKGLPGGPGEPQTPPATPPSAPPDEAPAPTPVPGDLPVTG